MIDLYDYTRPGLRDLLVSWEFSPAHAARLFRYLYHQLVMSPGEMTELPPKLVARLCDEARLSSPTVQRVATTDDGRTEKYLLGLRDGEAIETVLMRGAQRVTACLSTQAGCAWGCVFCATGQMGWRRHLTAGEIVAQALHVARRARATAQDAAHARLRNIVLMGMGEPLHNYDQTMTALEILGDPQGLALAKKQLTISTVGVVPGIIRLADERRPYALAVSLHAATQAERAALLPIAKTWPLEELMAACRYYSTKLAQRIFFEWTFIDGANDSVATAHTLAALLQGLPAHVNLIPLNATAGYTGVAGQPAALVAFQQVLRDRGIPSTVRRRRGIEITAGCGQLAVTS